MQFEPGMRLTDSIQLREMVGEGGMGQIWAGEHLLLRRPVAIKRLSSQFSDNAEARRRFAAEARAGASTECPHVARVFDYAFLADGTPFMVMELLEGAELYASIRNGTALSLEETEQIVVQICSALSEIHALGIVHRDVKPENIFLSRQRPERGGGGAGFTAKLLDFGIAKGTGVTDEPARPEGTVLGTPAYMSPEQIDDAATVDGRADLWSLAVVAYCCLTGSLPFQGDTLPVLSLAIHGAHFAPATSLQPALPAALDGWLLKALNCDLEARFASAGEMAAAFVRASRGFPIEDKPLATHRPRLELVMTPAAPMRAWSFSEAPRSSVLTVTGRDAAARRRALAR
jgi:serine/threonine-protein kinase